MNAAVYNAVSARARSRCEACGGEGPRRWPLELDHFAGRKHVAEAVDNCWLLCRSCHFAKTNSKPSARFWFERFIAFCERHGYAESRARAERELAWRLAKGTVK